MNHNRRNFFKTASILAVGAGIPVSCQSSPQVAQKSLKPSNRIGVSTYSFWQFNGPKENCPIEMCIDKAAEMGFDGIELLLMQMTSEENSYLQSLKRRAFHAGLDLMGFSTHQGFVLPDKAKRDEEMRLREEAASEKERLSKMEGNTEMREGRRPGGQGRRDTAAIRRMMQNTW